MSFEFILDHLYPLPVRTKKMFGTEAIYVNEHMMLAVRDRSDKIEDNGIWIGTKKEHHPSLLQTFPSLRYLIHIPLKKWLLLPGNAPDFEETALEICQLIKRGDTRIGI